MDNPMGMPNLTGFPGSGAQPMRMPFSGPINTPVPGRTDRHHMNVKNGSYVIPADVVSGVGQGNTQAGHAAFNALFPKTKLPHGHLPSSRPPREARHALHGMKGIHMPMASGGKADRLDFFHSRLSDVPASENIEDRRSYDPTMHPMTPAQNRALMYPSDLASNVVDDNPEGLSAKAGYWDIPSSAPNPIGYNAGIPEMAHGGEDSDGDNPEVVTAGGEHVLTPEQIIARYGDLDKGHNLLDELVEKRRAKTIKEMQKLPGPKK